ncbi:hypothetical protein MRX96_003709 [Rhipicephalus microplus]
MSLSRADLVGQLDSGLPAVAAVTLRRHRHRLANRARASAAEASNLNSINPWPVMRESSCPGQGAPPQIKERGDSTAAEEEAPIRRTAGITWLAECMRAALP